MQPPVVLSVAGSDSGGGAGIQADLATFAGLGVLGAVALTAVTAQSTTAVHDVVVLAPDLVTRQVEAVTGDVAVAASKTGMLASPATIAEVGRLAAAGLLPNLVVDPVLAASTGRPLAGEPAAAAAAYRRHLLPRCTVACPNAAEALLLAGRHPAATATGGPLPLDSLVDAAEALRDLGAPVVVVTGGDVDVAGDPSGARGGSSVDVVVGPDGVTVLDGERVQTRNTHGTGCTFSAAVAAGLALGMAPLPAVRMAKRYVADALRGARGWRIGAGSGPLDHGVWRRRAEGISGAG